jgi:hypothetical protein
MVLLSLGPQALIALLHTEKRLDCGASDPFWLSTAVASVVSGPDQTEEASAFPSFLQSSN